MISAEPLILVLIVLVVLWLVGVQLSKVSSVSLQRPAVIHGVQITPYLHVTGLKDYLCDELKAIVNHCDEQALEKFIAYYQPRFVELDDYIDVLRTRFSESLGKPLESASQIEKIAAANRLLLNDQPESYDINQLSKAEIRMLLEHGEHKRQAVNQEFIAQFGDAQYLENFNAYKHLVHDQGRTLFVPKKDSNRPLLDMLAEHGVAMKGRKIELKDRLRILPLKQLNDMAKELKIGKIFQSHEIAVETMADTPGSAILLAMVYSIDDLFYLDPKAVDIEAIEHELEVWACYTKLIAWPAKQTAPDMAVNRTL